MLQYSKNPDMSKCFFLIFAALFPGIRVYVYNLKFMVPRIYFSFLGAYCRICQITSLFLDSPLSAGSNETDSLMYQCPQPGDPHTFTDCCIMDPNDKPRACCEPRNVGFFPGVDDEYVKSKEWLCLTKLVILHVLFIFACCLRYSIHTFDVYIMRD